jgi:hypothetical protein
VGPADFGAIPEACPGGDLALRVRGTLLVASSAPDFYGNATAGATLRYRLPMTARTWLSLAVDAATFRYVANAVVPSSGVTGGPPTVGLYHAIAGSPDWNVAVYGRGLLPFGGGRHNGFETGLELGSVARLARRSRMGLEGGLAMVAPVDVTDGVPHRFLRPAGLLEAWYEPRSWVALAVGAEARAEVSPDPNFTSLAPRVSARFALRHQLWLAALVEVPVVGTDRTDLVAGFYAGWTP